MDAQGVSASTGLDPESVALAIADLKALRIVGDDLRPSVPRQPRHDTELPRGVEPWSGDEMAQGTASTHDELAREARESSVPPSSRRPSAPATAAAESSNHRQVYETTIRHLDIDQRIDLAAHAEQGLLLPLCLDPSPRVIAQLLQHPKFGLDHARALAAHHGSAQGLEMLARRADLLRDAHVFRRLLRNSQLSEAVLSRLIRTKRLAEVHRLSVDRELPDRTRTRVRRSLRAAFARAEPEERTSLILRSEGRCLMLLTGCTFDGRTTQLLCSHSFTSTLLVQNLARFAATPPPVLAKLMRSGPVRRQPQLRAMVQRHPNLGGEWRGK